MKIAICDDDYGICEELSKWLRKADNDSRKQMIEVFQEAEKTADIDSEWSCL